MSKIGELPQGNGNTQEGKEARIAKLKKERTERELIGIFNAFNPLYLDKHRAERLYQDFEFIRFKKKLAEVIRALLLLDAFGDDEELKSSCQEILPFLDNLDPGSREKCTDLVNKVDKFFGQKRTSSRSYLP